eukprot:2113381-Prymnesium_polylepis.1
MASTPVSSSPTSTPSRGAPPSISTAAKLSSRNACGASSGKRVGEASSEVGPTASRSSSRISSMSALILPAALA